MTEYFVLLDFRDDLVRNFKEFVTFSLNCRKQGWKISIFIKFFSFLIKENFLCFQSLPRKTQPHKIENT